MSQAQEKKPTIQFVLHELVNSVDSIVQVLLKHGFVIEFSADQLHEQINQTEK